MHLENVTMNIRIAVTRVISLFVLMDHLSAVLLENFQTTIEESRNKLYYFLAHQARKVHLNNQFKANLDDDGAILVCDYKMRILPKSARETKEQFLEKAGGRFTRF